jgi:hypothetical protein
MTSWPLTVLAAALLAAPAPAPAPEAVAPAPAVSSPAPSASGASDEKLGALKEIGHVKATTAFCQAIIDHASKAVTLGIDNDQRISVVVQTLRTHDFDLNLLSKNRVLLDLSNQNGPLTEQAVAAEKAAKALRVDAATAPTPEEAKELIAFADALDGALHRQRTIARDVASMIAIFNAHPVITKEERDEAVLNEQLKDNYRGAVTYMPPEDRVVPLMSKMASDGADDIVFRQSGIAHDELSAADLVEPVFGGC